VNVIAALSGPWPKAGVIVAGLLVAVALVHPVSPWRAAAMLGGLILAPVLLLADIWHSPQLSVVHRHPLVAVVAALLGVAVVGALAVAIARRPAWLALLVILTLPFRVPISAGGTTANLLVPLYLVVGAGTLAYLWPLLLGREPGWGGRWRLEGSSLPSAAVWVQRLLAVVVALYAIQSIYSSDFEKALQQLVFFYVPFALLFCLLRELDWTPELLRRCVALVAVLALVFACVGFAEYATKTLFLNPKLVAANQVHAYFTVNSVFFDPDIFGRFLALVMVIVAAVLLYARERREQLAAVAVLAVLWAALVLTLSRSSLAALLLGLGVLGAMRWKARRILIAGVAVIIVGIAAVAASPKTFGLNQGLNGASSGRAGLVSGGLHLFAHRPGWGYGSGSFEVRYRALHPGTAQTLAASHTIAITIAAEQGLIGELPYLALVLVAFVALLRGARGDPARTAIAAAFSALVLHTELYADFLEDPVTWTLLAMGVALAYAARRRPSSAARVEPSRSLASART
jgi:putative inorganic carbon (HCO3(-)) transporter